MSMKTMLLAAATAATLLIPAAALAQDYGHNRSFDRRDDRRVEAPRWQGHDRRDDRADGYGYGYGYEAYPVYGYDAYGYAAPAWRDRDRDDRHDRDRDRDHGRYGR